MRPSESCPAPAASWPEPSFAVAGAVRELARAVLELTRAVGELGAAGVQLVGAVRDLVRPVRELTGTAGELAPPLDLAQASGQAPRLAGVAAERAGGQLYARTAAWCPCRKREPLVARAPAPQTSVLLAVVPPFAGRRRS